MPARDVFICHAHADKARYVRPLAASLGRFAVSCWVDEGEISAGDSIIDAVNDGLRLSQYVLVTVTPEFLSRRWPRRELNAALSREIRSGQTVVIPVLAVSHEEWAKAFPLLEDKRYLRWENDPDPLARAVAQLFDRQPASDWSCDHPTEWKGLVWTRCNPVDDGEHTVTLRWGPLVRRLTHRCDDGAPWSMVHHKLRADRVTLHVHVEPPAIITFGQGPSPDPVPGAINIDEGWTRSAGAVMEESAAPMNASVPTDRAALAKWLGNEDPLA